MGIIAAVSADLLAPIADCLVATLRPLRFAPPVAHVYNPLDYARSAYDQYVARFAGPGREALFLGMNPGPWGMAQTGVPFGAIPAVRDWMRLDGSGLRRPADEHPKRPIDGFGCTREEVSGSRLWGWARDRFGTPEDFFARFYVTNYCPLVFLADSGRNLTPDKLPAAERRAVTDACDRALRDTVVALAPRRVVGIGAWAERRAQEALQGLDVPIHRILHPSPASPAANRGWADGAERQLAALGIELVGEGAPSFERCL